MSTVKACQEWDESLLVGDTIIDSEHKRIIELACAFVCLVQRDVLPFREVLKMVKEVSFYVITHFQHEELLLELYNANLEDILKHKREHLELRKSFTKTIENIREADEVQFKENCERLVNELYDLITNHIATTDKTTLKPCIQAHDRYFNNLR